MTGGGRGHTGSGSVCHLLNQRFPPGRVSPSCCQSPHPPPQHTPCRWHWSMLSQYNIFTVTLVNIYLCVFHRVEALAGYLMHLKMLWCQNSCHVRQLWCCRLSVEDKLHEGATPWLDKNIEKCSLVALSGALYLTPLFQCDSRQPTQLTQLPKLMQQSKKQFDVSRRLKERYSHIFTFPWS